MNKAFKSHKLTYKQLATGSWSNIHKRERMFFSSMGCGFVEVCADDGFFDFELEY